MELIDLLTWDGLKQYFLDQMTNNEFFSAAAFAGLMSSLWYYGKKYPAQIWERIKRKMVYTVTVYEYSELYSYINVWLYHNKYKSYRNVEAFYNYTKGKAFYRQFEDLIFLRFGWNIVRVWKGREKLENASNMMNAHLNHFKFSGFFIKKLMERFFQEVIDFNAELTSQERVFIPSVYFNERATWHKFDDVDPKDLDKIIMEGKEDLVNDVSNFLEDSKWYDDRGIVHKRGYLLYGAAGNGKTSLIFAIAKHFKRNTYILNPTKIDDGDLLHLFKTIPQNSILAIEDIDGFFNSKREKEDNNIGFNFSTLLNALDGAFSKRGIMVFFTTNHVERLDSALIRSGRMDYHFEVKNPTVEKIEEYLKMFYQVEGVDFQYKGENNVVPMAKVQDVCLSNRRDFVSAVNNLDELLLENK